MKILASPIVFNEEKKIGGVIKRFKESGVLRLVDLLVIDDASTDGSKTLVEAEGVKVLSHSQRLGAGASIRSSIHYACGNGYDTVVILSGSGKNDPAEIPRLVDPIIKGECDLVQGSRYAPGGESRNMPFYRQIATRFIHPWLFSLLVGRKVTDSTSGFRAIKLSILDDKRIDLNQDWLDKYELEPYLFYKAITLGYRICEVPITLTYPPKKLGYSKMKPIIGWWSILRPIFLLGLGIKK